MPAEEETGKAGLEGNATLGRAQECITPALEWQGVVLCGCNLFDQLKSDF